MAAIKNSKTTNENDNVSAEISTLGKNLYASMPNAAFSSFTEVYSNWLPDSGIKIIKSAARNRLSVRFSVDAAPSILFDNDGLTVRMKQPVTPKQIGASAAVLLSQLLEKELNSDGIVSLNASCISYNGNCALFLGDSGSGKTTSALYACLADKKTRLVSGKRVYVQNGDKVINGVSKINIRFGSISEEFNSFPEISKVKRDLSYDSADKKIMANPELLGIKREVDYPCKLKDIIFVKKLNTPLNIQRVTAPEDEEFFRIYASLGDGGGIVSANRLPIPFIFDYTERTRRAKYAEQLISIASLSYVEGRLPDITSFVLNQLKMKRD